MAGVLVKQGDDIPLHLQLKTHETGKHVRAVIKDDSGAAYATVTLADKADGLYVNTSLVMPGKNLLATYQTADDAEFSNITDWEAGIDIFVLDSFHFLSRRDHFVGVLETDRMVNAAIPNNQILGEFFEEHIDGVISNNKMIGDLSDNMITGVIGCNK